MIRAVVVGLVLAGLLLYAAERAPVSRERAPRFAETTAYERAQDARARRAVARLRAEIRAAGGGSVALGAGRCRYRAEGALPDASCTPGALNPAVTQGTIGSTVCVAGWTSTVRPSASVTAPIKLDLLAAYGQPAVTADYELDHLVPLELGGAPADPRNLWPEPRSAGALDKDAVENRLRALVCVGEMTLARARRIVRTDWRTAP